MEILARGVGRRKEAVAQVLIVKGTGLFIINQIPAQQYLHNNTCTLLSVKAPFDVLNSSSTAGDQLTGNLNQTEEINSIENFSFVENMNTIVKVKGGGLVGQAEAIKLGLARALCELKLTRGLDANDTTHLSSVKTPESREGLPDLSEEKIEMSASNADQSVESLENLQISGPKPEDIRKQLKDKGYLTQDSRVKERRKYGLKKARKATQYNKR